MNNFFLFATILLLAATVANGHAENPPLADTQLDEEGNTRFLRGASSGAGGSPPPEERNLVLPITCLSLCCTMPFLPGAC